MKIKLELAGPEGFGRITTKTGARNGINLDAAVDDTGVGALYVKTRVHIEFLFFLDQAQPADQGYAVVEGILILAEHGIGIGFQHGIGAYILGRAGNAVGGDLQPVVRIRIDIQVVQAQHPVAVFRAAGQARFLGEAGGVRARIVRQLVHWRRIHVNEEQLFVILVIRYQGQRYGIRQLVFDSAVQPPGVGKTGICEGKVT